MKKARESVWQEWLKILIGLVLVLGVFQSGQCIAWVYDQVVAYVAADITAKQEGGRRVTECGWTTCTSYWRYER